MLEILLLIHFSKKIGALAESKGYPKGRYQWMLLGMWIVGEFLGGQIGGAMASGSDQAICVAYIIAIIGAALGAWVAFSIVRNLPTAEIPTRSPLSLWAIVGVCILAFAVGEAIYSPIFSNFYRLMIGNSYDYNSLTPFAITRIIVDLLYGVIIGVILAAGLTGWKRTGAWIGAFAGGSALFGLLVVLQLIIRRNLNIDSKIAINFISIVMGVVQGVIFSLVFSFRIQREPEYQADNPLPRMLVAGIAAFTLTSAINILSVELRTGSNFWSNHYLLYDFSLGVISGILYGVALGLALVWMRLFPLQADEGIADARPYRPARV